MSNQLQQTNSSGIQRGTKNVSNLLGRLTKQRRFDQLCLLILDGSGSMTNELKDDMTKASAAASAARGLLTSLQNSSNSPSFSLAVICFAEITEVRLHAQYVEHLKVQQIDFDPFPKGGTFAYTYVGKALYEAEKIGEAFINSALPDNGLKRTVRIMLITDGYATDYGEALYAANLIKEKWNDSMRINTALFGRKDEEDYELAESVLMELSSYTPQGKLCYTRTPSEAELRAFFERSSTND